MRLTVSAKIDQYRGNPLRSFWRIFRKVEKRKILTTLVSFVVRTVIYTAMIVSHICELFPLKLHVTRPSKWPHARPASFWCGTRSKMAVRDIGVLDNYVIYDTRNLHKGWLGWYLLGNVIVHQRLNLSNNSNIWHILLCNTVALTHFKGPGCVL